MGEGRVSRQGASAGREGQLSYQEETDAVAPAARASELLREAVAAARAGEKRHARNLLRELLEMRPDHEQGLLWAAALAETMDGAFWFLQRLLQVNPNNQQAANILAMHEARVTVQAPPTRPPLPRKVTSPLPNADAADPQAPAGPVLREAPEPPPKPLPQVRRWNCPVCLAETITEPRRCPRCHCMTSLSDLQAIAKNDGLDDRLVTEGLRELLRKANTEPSFESFSNLGTLLLNLKRSAEALPWLRKALEACPSDSMMSVAVHLLEQRKLILAVDDSQTVRRVVALILEQQGYRVVTASDGMQALARLNEYMPDLILLDVGMPRMDGYQVCKVIKRNSYTRSIPVLMLSGNDGFFDKVKGRMAGATDYLTKPLSEEALLQAVAKHVITASVERKE